VVVRFIYISEIVKLHFFFFIVTVQCHDYLIKTNPDFTKGSSFGARYSDVSSYFNFCIFYCLNENDEIRLQLMKSLKIPKG
jgi:hypothetical protein